MSSRFCQGCMAITNWKIDTVVNHSYCTVCGCRFGISKKEKMINFINAEYSKKFFQLAKEYSEKIGKISKLKKEDINPNAEGEN